MKDGTVGLIALAVGCTVAVAAIVTYEAWWTIAFAIGGAAVATYERRGQAPARSLIIGAAIGAVAVLAAMSMFLLYFGASGGGAKWLLAGVGSAAVAITLVLIVRGRLTRRAS